MADKLDRYKVLAVRKPGQKGTNRLVAKYGSRLRCVRYLYDRLTGEKLKTVELVEFLSQWVANDFNPQELVGVRLGMHEVELRQKIKARGGRWDHYDRLWILKYEEVESLGLQNREVTIREEPAQYEV